MGAFGGLIITNKGIALQAKVQAGAELHFSRIGVGDGTLGGQSIPTLTNLISEKMSLDITKLKVLGGGKAVVGGVLSNQGVTTGFYFREIGVFAMDPDEGEILYCYGNAGSGAEYIPPGGGPDVIEKQIDIVTIIGNASNVSAEIPSAVYATVDQLEAHINATAGAHGATPDPTPNTIVQRDSAGQAHFWPPTAGTHVAIKGYVDNTVQTNLNNHAADYVRHPGFGVTGGSGNSFTVTLSPAPTAYVDGMGVVIRANRDNTGAATLNVNGLGARSIKRANGLDIAPGMIKNGGIYTLRYNNASGNFILQGEGGSGDAQPSDVLSGKTFTNDFGEQVGTMPNHTGHVTGQSISRSGTTLRIRPQAGYYPGGSGNSVQWNDPNWVAANIREGVSIFGLVGTLLPAGSPLASGVATGSPSFETRTFVRDDGGTVPQSFIEVTGLALPTEPNLIIAIYLGVIQLSKAGLTIFRREGLSNYYGASQGKIVVAQDTGSGQVGWYQLDGSAAIATATAFRLPIYSGLSGRQIEWYIWG